MQLVADVVRLITQSDAQEGSSRRGSLYAPLTRYSILVLSLAVCMQLLSGCRMVSTCDSDSFYLNRLPEGPYSPNSLQGSSAAVNPLSMISWRIRAFSLFYRADILRILSQSSAS